MNWKLTKTRVHSRLFVELNFYPFSGNLISRIMFFTIKALTPLICNLAATLCIVLNRTNVDRCFGNWARALLIFVHSLALSFVFFDFPSSGINVGHFERIRPELHGLGLAASPSLRWKFFEFCAVLDKVHRAVILVHFRRKWMILRCPRHLISLTFRFFVT